MQGFEGVHRCRLNESLHTIVERIVKAGVSVSLGQSLRYVRGNGV